MTVLAQLQKDAHPANGKPPRALLIRDDQLELLVAELNEMRMHPFKDGPKLTANDVRVHGCRLYGIAVRVVGF